MEYLFLLAVVVLVSLQDILKKQYNSRSQSPCTFLFSFFTSVGAILLFIATSGFSPDFRADVLPYSVCFAAAFASAIAGSFFAIKYGSLSITILVTSYSLIIPALYGVFALGDTLGTFGIIGLALLFISIFLINAKREKVSINTKWIISLLFAFVGNGMCSLIQKTQQLKFDGEYKSEFMIVALLISAVLFLILALVKRERILRGDMKLIPLSVATGIANGITNYLVMVLTGLIPSVILFPVISAGGIVIGFLVALFIYRERLNKIQYIGYFIGIASIILLNL